MFSYYFFNNELLNIGFLNTVCNWFELVFNKTYNSRERGVLFIYVRMLFNPNWLTYGVVRGCPEMYDWWKYLQNKPKIKHVTVFLDLLNTSNHGLFVKNCLHLDDQIIPVMFWFVYSLYSYASTCVATTFRPCGATPLKIYREAMTYLKPRVCSGAVKVTAVMLTLAMTMCKPLFDVLL